MHELNYQILFILLNLNPYKKKKKKAFILSSVLEGHKEDITGTYSMTHVFYILILFLYTILAITKL
jgi:hypothetical protein